MQIEQTIQSVLSALPLVQLVSHFCRCHEKMPMGIDCARNNCEKSFQRHRKYLALNPRIVDHSVRICHTVGQRLVVPRARLLVYAPNRSISSNLSPLEYSQMAPATKAHRRNY